MRTNWDGFELDVSATPVPTGGHNGLPDYVRLEMTSYPLQLHTIMTPADARKLAHEIYDAAMKADSAQQAAQIELIAFELEPAS